MVIVMNRTDQESPPDCLPNTIKKDTTKPSSQISQASVYL